MRKVVLTVLVMGTAYLHSIAQSVGIGTNAPNASAQLDVSSNTKGMLVPRMTQIERDAIATPAQGLILFNTTTKIYMLTLFYKIAV